uniref:hypothetical protein n=1 Tax=Acetatifactor sp. TaxID=1872090 RepID=UPI0040560C3F
MFKGWCGLVAVALNGGYTLIEIEEEPVPLGVFEETGAGYFTTVLAVMILILIVLMIVFYFMNCYKCKMRIKQLQHDQNVYHGWNLGRLRETVEELELQETDALVCDMEENFRKKFQNVEPFLE